VWFLLWISSIGPAYLIPYESYYPDVLPPVNTSFFWEKNEISTLYIYIYISICISIYTCVHLSGLDYWMLVKKKLKYLRKWLFVDGVPLGCKCEWYEINSACAGSQCENATYYTTKLSSII